MIQPLYCHGLHRRENRSTHTVHALSQARDILITASAFSAVAESVNLLRIEWILLQAYHHSTKLKGERDEEASRHLRQYWTTRQPITLNEGLLTRISYLMCRMRSKQPPRSAQPTPPTSD